MRRGTRVSGRPGRGLRPSVRRIVVLMVSLSLAVSTAAVAMPAGRGIGVWEGCRPGAGQGLRLREGSDVLHRQE